MAVRPWFHHAVVGRADDLVHVDQLFDAVGAPAHDAGDGEDRGVELQGDVQHAVNKAAVEVHVGADALENVPFPGDDLGGKPFDHGVKGEVVVPSLFRGQLFHEALEHLGPGVGQGVDGVAHPVNQALVVEGFFIEELVQVAPDFFFILEVGHIGLQVVHHFHHLDVGAAVLGALEGRQGRRDDGIGVGTRGGDHPGGEGGVVPAAVFHVEHQGDVQDPGFQVGVFLVRTEHEQDVFSGGQIGVGPVDVQAFVVDVVVVGLIAVHSHHGELADQGHALAQHVVQGGVGDPVVVGGQGQHAAGHGVHQVLAGGLHDDVPGEVGGKGPGGHQHFVEADDLFLGGQLPKEEQVGDFLVAVALALEALDQVDDVVAPVPETAVARDFFPVYHLKGVDAGDVGQSGQDALSVFIPESALDAVFAEELNGNLVLALADFCVFLRVFPQGMVAVLCFSHMDSPVYSKYFNTLERL